MSIETVTGAKSRNMMPGLVSGMDTASMVDSMLSGTQSKLDKQNATKQQILWKQEIYRDIISKANAFQTNYMTYSSSKNINFLSNSFYNTMTTSSSSSAVKVLSTGSNAPGSMSIKVNHLATAYKAKSTTPVSRNLEGSVDMAKLLDGKTYSIDVTLDGVRKTIEFQGVHDPAQTADQNIQDTIDNLNQNLKYVFGSTVQAVKNGGKIMIGGSSATNTITVNKTAVNAGDPDKPEDALGLFGLSEGASNKVNLNQELGNGSFLQELTGDKFEFSINGKKITVDRNQSLAEVIGSINGSGANVRVTYSSSEDRFMIESTLMGDISGIKMEQTSGNLLSVLFGKGSGSGVTGGKVTANELKAKDSIDSTLFSAILNTTDKSNATMTLNVNGMQIGVSVPANPAGVPYTEGEFVQELNKALESRFGKGTDGNANISLEISGGQAMIHSSDGYSVQIDRTGDFNMMEALGFGEGQKQDATEDTLLSDLGLGGTINVNGTSLTVNPAWSLKDFARELQNAGAGTVTFDNDAGTLSIQGITGSGFTLSGGDADGNALLEKLIGNSSVTFNTADASLTETAGRNAELEVNGVLIERNSNQFLLDGITIQLMETTTSAISLTSERNTDKIVEGVKDFVKDYNEFIDGVNSLLHEKAMYQQYPPLTAEQKKEMSESEVKLWEENAKKGLVRSDDDISAFLSNMRTAFYSKLDEAGMGIYDIGIETSSNYKDYGKLVVNEEKLKEAVANNIEGVQKLFMADKKIVNGEEQQGIMRLLDDYIKKAVNMSSGSPGTLVRTAGVAGMTTETMNYMYDQLKGIDQKIAQLKNQYTTEYNRYWKQFTQMEKMIQNMNSQGSWLSQQFS